MGATPSKSDAKLHTINDNVNSIRSSIRSTKRLQDESRNSLLDYMVQQTEDLKKLQKKIPRKKFDETMGLITNVTDELVTNSLSLRSSESAPNLNSERRTSSIQRSSAIRRASLPTSSDIETKFISIKPFIATAIQNGDRKQLILYRKTIKLLVDDLQAQPEEVDQKLISQLSACYQRIDKTIRDLTRTSNINYLTGLNDKEKAWKELELIELDLRKVQKNLERDLNDHQSQNLRNNLLQLKSKLGELEGLDDNIKLKKVQLGQRTQQLLIAVSKKNDHFDFEQVMSEINRRVSDKKLTQQEVDHLTTQLEALLQKLKSYQLGSETLKSTIRRDQTFIQQPTSTIERIEELRKLQKKVDFIAEKVDDCSSNQDMTEQLQNCKKTTEELKRTSKDDNVIDKSCKLIEEIDRVLSLQNSEIFVKLSVIKSCVNSLVNNVGALSDDSEIPIFLSLIDEFQRNKNELERTDSSDFNNLKVKLIQIIDSQLKLIQQRIYQVEIKFHQNYFEELKGLQLLVDRFSGTYKSLIYVDIEKKLNTFLSLVIEKVHSRRISASLREEIERCLKILEHKSVKPEELRLSIDQPPNQQENQSKQVADQIDKLYLQIATFSDVPGSEGFVELEGKLKELRFEVDRLKSDQLSEKLNWFGAELASRAQDCQTVREIRRQLFQIENQITGDLNPNERSDLEEDLIGFQIKLGRMEFSDQTKTACDRKIIDLLKSLKIEGSFGTYV